MYPHYANSLTESWNIILNQQLEWSLIKVLVALCVHHVTENFWFQPSTERALKKPPSVAKNRLNRRRRWRNAKCFSCSLCSLTKWASSLHLNLLHPSVNETLPLSSWDQGLLETSVWVSRPWHQGLETQTLVKWTWVLSSLETNVSRSQDHNTEF